MEQEGIAILADRKIGHCPTSTCVVLGEEGYLLDSGDHNG